MSDGESRVDAPGDEATRTRSVHDRVDRVDRGEADAGEPPWLVAGLLVALSGLAVAGIVGLALAIAAVFDPLLVALIGVPIWIVVVILGWPLVRQARARPPLRHATAATLCMLVFLLGWLAWNFPRTSQHVLIDRDPGSYTNSARWIAREGSLEVDVSKPRFLRQSDLVFGSNAMYLMPGEKLQFQFTHFAPVVLAEMHGLGGDRLMFRGTLFVAVLALLALFALALRILRRPWLALAATIGLAVSLPQVWFARDTYSEIPMQALLLGGFWLLASTRRSPRLGPPLVAGFIFGTMAATRIDAPLLLIAPIVVIGVEWYGTRPRDRRVARLACVFTAAAAVPLAVGTVDLTTRSGYYDSAHGHQYRAVWAATLLALVGTSIVVAVRDHLPGVRSWLAEQRDALGTAAAVLTAGVLVFLWGPRRIISTPSKLHTNPTMRAIQLREGIRPASGKRTYAEQSVEWIRWNIGVIALILGIVGAAILASELIRRRRRDALGLFVAFCTGGVLYLWQPTIFPDQPWAMRRFLPVLLPAMFVFGALTIDWLVRWIARRSTPRVSGIAGAVLVAGLVLPAAIGTWPVRDMRSQANYVKPVLWTCDQIGPNAAVIVLPSKSEPVERTLPQAFRSWCGVPVAVAKQQLSPQRTATLRRAARAAGLDLFLVAGEGDPLEAAGARHIRPSVTAYNPYSLTTTLAKRPDELKGSSFTIALGKA